MALITAKNIEKDYRMGEVVIHALRSITFSIEPSSFVSFVGPSGSGKTTLLNLIGCLDKPTKGELWIADTDVSTIHQNQKKSASFRGGHIGFIFQEFNLIPVLTVYENIEYPLVIVQNVGGRERKKRVMSLLDAVGMADQKDKYPKQISGGQKQRAAIARALVSSPELVIADEPTANLDHKTGHMVIDLMKRMRDEFKTTFVFSTHDPKVMKEAEIIYGLEDGKLNGAKSKEEKSDA